MRNNYSYLKDSSFLQLISMETNQEQYVKITVLDFLKEEPLHSIEGKVTGGNLNLDGSSSIRRTGDISLVANEGENNLTNIDFFISINKKVYIELGLLNQTNYYKEYDIIWIPLGTFVIFEPSITHTADGVNISLSLKDKMCLLNGECGGTIPASVDFHNMDTWSSKEETGDEDNDNSGYSTEYVTIYQLIQELVHHWGGEQLGKIIISDIPHRIKSVIRWQDEENNLHVLKTNNEPGVYNIYVEPNGVPCIHDNMHTIGYFKNGDIVGYRYKDFTYPTSEELTCNAGDSVVTVLDKIKNFLGGNYEYFYDIDGNFIFQEIKNYLNTSQATLELDKMNNENYLIDRSKGKALYTFDNGKMITSYSNSPLFSMIKNEFIAWGIKKKTTEDSKDIPIRYRLAIDKKPMVGTRYEEVVINEMHDDGILRLDFPLKFSNFNSLPIPGVEGYVYRTEEKKIENDKENITYHYYMWEYVLDTRTYENGEFKELEEDEKENPKTPGYVYKSYPFYEVAFIATDWRTELYLQGSYARSKGTSTNVYFEDLYNEWGKIYSYEKVENQDYYTDILRPEFNPENKRKDNKDLNLSDEELFDYMNKTDWFDFLKYDYYLDFIDTDSALGGLSVSNIGRRTQVTNEDSINCIFEPEIPNITFVFSEDLLGARGKEFEQELSRSEGEPGIGYVVVKEDEDFIKSKLTLMPNYNSAFNEIRNLLYVYTSYNETISLSMIPCYYLEPNIRISVTDSECGIFGDYIIGSISLPLGIEETATITATRAMQKI